MPKPPSSLLARALVSLMAAGMAAGVADAQTTRILPITFTGTITTAAADTLKIRQGDGSYAPYAGALPEPAYVSGQSVKVSFKASVPNANYYAINPTAAAMTRAPDGRYRITLYSEGSGLAGLSVPGIGTAGAPVVSGGIVATGNPKNGGGMTLALTLYFDPLTDSYTIAPGSSFVAGYFSGPSYLYDAAAGALVPCTGAGCDPTGTGANLFGLTGNAANTQVSAVNVPVLNSAGGGLAGLYTMVLSGAWTLGSTVTQHVADNVPAPVPEPAVVAPLAEPVSVAPPVSAPVQAAPLVAATPLVILTGEARVRRKAARARIDRR